MKIGCARSFENDKKNTYILKIGCDRSFEIDKKNTSVMKTGCARSFEICKKIMCIMKNQCDRCCMLYIDHMIYGGLRIKQMCICKLAFVYASACVCVFVVITCTPMAARCLDCHLAIRYTQQCPIFDLSL